MKLLYNTFALGKSDVIILLHKSLHLNELNMHVVTFTQARGAS